MTGLQRHENFDQGKNITNTTKNRRILPYLPGFGFRPLLVSLSSFVTHFWIDSIVSIKCHDTPLVLPFLLLTDKKNYGRGQHREKVN